jgi:hypothetical protein
LRLSSLAIFVATVAMCGSLNPHQWITRFGTRKTRSVVEMPWFHICPGHPLMLKRGVYKTLQRSNGMGTDSLPDTPSALRLSWKATYLISMITGHKI